MQNLQNYAIALLALGLLISAIDVDSRLAALTKRLDAVEHTIAKGQ